MKRAVSSDALDYFEKGVVRYDQRKYKEAIKCFESAIKLFPQYAAALAKEADAFSALSKNDWACETYEEAADTFLIQGKFDEALKTSDKCIMLDPEYASILEKKADALWGMGRYAEAIEAYDQYYKIVNDSSMDPSVEEIFDIKGVELAEIGKYQEAIMCFDIALGWDENWQYSWNNKGVVLYGLGEYDEAIRHFHEAGNFGDDHWWYNLGNVLSHQGNHKEAIDAYSSDANEVAALWNNMGVALFHLGNDKKAMDAFTKAQELDPDLASAWHNKALVLRKQGKTSITIPN